MGGVGACVILADAKTGAVLYQYNTDKVCNAKLPPCATFKIATTLIGLDAGVVTPPDGVQMGRHAPAGEGLGAGRRHQGRRNAIGWWFQRLASRSAMTATRSG